MGLAPLRLLPRPRRLMYIGAGVLLVIVVLVVLILFLRRR
jgi:flagellar biosynthesis/type III secretory pathway M-ring protein FliF/YscJ